MWIWLKTIVIGMSLCISTVWAAPIALLVGVSDYHPESGVSALLGPKNDVLALQEVLINKWGFAPANIKVLLNEQATHANIVSELQQLKSRSQAGDHIFIYFSGHGTSAFDLKMGLPLPHTTGGFVPYDFSIPQLKQTLHLKLAPQEKHPYLNQHLLVGQWHLRPILQQLEKDRVVTVMMDSCFSGKSTRSSLRANAQSKAVSKMIALPHQMSSLAMDDYSALMQEEEYPYENVISIVASREMEIANDLQDRGLTLTGKEHGLLTDIMLRILHGNLHADLNHDGQISYAEVRDVVRKQALHYPLTRHQSPQILPDFAVDPKALNQKSLFSYPRSAAITATAAGAPKLTIYVQQPQLAQLLKTELPSIEWTTDQRKFDLKLSQEGTGWTLSLGNGESILIQAPKQQMLQRIRAELYLKTLAQRATSPSHLHVQATPSKKDHVFDAGDRIQFQIQSDRNAQLILLTLNNEGKVRLLYPIDAKELNPIVAHKITTFPTQDTIVIQPPFGLETVIALTMPQSLTILPELTQMVHNHLELDHPVFKKFDHFIAQQSSLAMKVLTLRSYEKFITAQSSEIK